MLSLVKVCGGSVQEVKELKSHSKQKKQTRKQGEGLDIPREWKLGQKKQEKKKKS